MQQVALLCVKFAGVHSCKGLYLIAEVACVCVRVCLSCTALTLVCALVKLRANATWKAMLLQQRARATVAPLPYMGVLLASAGLVQTKTAPRGFEFMLSSFVCCRYEDGHFCCGDMPRDST